MRRGKIVFIIVMGLIVAYVIAGPYITVYQMKSAAEHYNGEALSEHIDFPAVRQSLKDQFNLMLAQKMTEDEEIKDNPFAAMGAAFAGMMVDKMVDAYVTPAAITLLMAGKKPEGAVNEGSGDGNDSLRKPFADASMSYASLDRFVVTVKDMDKEAGRFVFRRSGIAWKLTEIILPLK